MEHRSERDRFISLLTGTISSLCSGGFLGSTNSVVRVDGLLGITLADKEVFLIQVNEQFECSIFQMKNCDTVDVTVAQTVDEDNDCLLDESYQRLPSAKNYYGGRATKATASCNKSRGIGKRVRGRPRKFQSTRGEIDNPFGKTLCVKLQYPDQSTADLDEMVVNSGLRPVGAQQKLHEMAPETSWAAAGEGQQGLLLECHSVPSIKLECASEIDESMQSSSVGVKMLKDRPKKSKPKSYTVRNSQIGTTSIAFPQAANDANTLLCPNEPSDISDGRVSQLPHDGTVDASGGHEMLETAEEGYYSQSVERTKIKRKKYTSETLAECLELVRSNRLSQRQAEKVFDIPRTTIQCKLAMMYPILDGQ